ncbi:MAG: efflux RND transporter periplasmic adaptor subunit [Pirellulales bacterium]
MSALLRCLCALLVFVALGAFAADKHDRGENGEERHDDQGDAEHGDDEHNGHDDNDHVIRLTPDQLAAFGVTLATAGPGRIDHGVELLGEVRPNGDTLAHVVPRFPGIVRQVRKSIGEDVRAGEVLATVESNESLAPYEIKTLVAGTIIERHITPGEAVDRDKQAFTIADLSAVWVDLAVYQKDLDHVRVGQSVLVRTGAGKAEAEGRISYIAPIVNEPTRTATARVLLHNPERSWRPGLFVTARILDPIQASVVVHRSAIQTLAGQSTVFVAHEGGFEPRPVTLGRMGDTMIEVLSGLSAGERYAATNSFLLKAELGKGEAEHEH